MVLIGDLGMGEPKDNKNNLLRFDNPSHDEFSRLLPLKPLKEIREKRSLSFSVTSITLGQASATYGTRARRGTMSELRLQ
jgi:hypothetical protein